MKLFLYNKFWESFIKINKDTQKKVSEFIKKFESNSKSHAIHLEPISTFKDPTLRTARIDQKYRVVIKEAVPGSLFLLLWIDNHDEAMEWARNKVIAWNKETQAYQIFTSDEELLSEVKNENSAEDSKYFGKYDRKVLLQIGVPEILMPSVLQIQNLDDLEEIENHLPADVFENLFALADGGSVDAIITDVREGRINSDEISEQIYSANNSRSFIEMTDDSLFNEALKGPLKKWKYYLHPSQSNLVNKNFRGPVKVSGGAGTGKTVVALHRLRYLSKHRRNDSQILFTTFTKELTNNLKGLAGELGIEEGTYRIANIDALAFELVKERQLLAKPLYVFGLNSGKKPEELWGEVLETKLSPFDAEFLAREYEVIVLQNNIDTLHEYLRTSRRGLGKPIGRRMRAEVWKLFEEFKELKEKSSLYFKQEIYNIVSNDLTEKNEYLFSHVIVDELQDFSNVELRFIRALAESGENDLFLVGDPLQNIYDKRINFSSLGINIRGRRSRRLKINYRTTEEIKNLALSVVKDVDFDDFDGGKEDKTGYLSLFHGIKPGYTIYRTNEEQWGSIIKEIKELIDSGYQYSDIGVAARLNDTKKTFRNFVHEQHIPYVEKDFLNSENEGIRVTTFHGIKGLEFKQVFLIGVNNRTLPKLPFDFQSLPDTEQLEIMKREKALFYVACSRAIERLVISGIGEKSQLISI